MYTLGINAVFHDSAACLVRDGVVTAAAEEERFTKIKHGKRPLPFTAWELPFHAMDYCLREEGITMADIDQIAYSFAPGIILDEIGGIESLELLPAKADGDVSPPLWSEWDPLFLAYVLRAPNQLRDGAPHHLRKRFSAGGRAPAWRYVPHHLAHAASAFYPSPFDEAAVMCIDGRGEMATTSYWKGRGSALSEIGKVEMPHSLGLLYEEITEYLGFLRSSDEYKVMALASFGKPAFTEELGSIIVTSEKGGYSMEPLELERRFGPKREKGGELESRHYDLARSLQAVLEERVIELGRWLRQETGDRSLCLAGGVALNCVMNARIRDSGLFESIWVQPAAGDAGTALGAALSADIEARSGSEREYRMETAYLGPSFDDGEIESFLRWSKLPYRKATNIASEAASILARDEIIGWFQGRMEFGPRALGARSILASPISPSMQQKLNEIKDREDFRPVAPVVIEEDAAEWFVGAGRSPFMLFVHDVVPEKRSRIPAVAHVDGTARIQTVRRSDNPLYYDVLGNFRDMTGVPILVNTSFNTRGEPIVCTPRDAVECFWTSPLDALVIGGFVLEKKRP